MTFYEGRAERDEVGGSYHCCLQLLDIKLRTVAHPSLLLYSAISVLQIDGILQFIMYY